MLFPSHILYYIGKDNLESAFLKIRDKDSFLEIQFWLPFNVAYQYVSNSKWEIDEPQESMIITREMF